MSGSGGQGSAGNVIAAVCSFFIPGLGQLVQGRVMAALIFFLVAVVVFVVTLGTLVVIVNIVSCVDAALWKGPR
jgi:TM2 domain-containing membrane protein YozV